MTILRSFSTLNDLQSSDPMKRGTREIRETCRFRDQYGVGGVGWVRNQPMTAVGSIFYNPFPQRVKEAPRRGCRRGGVSVCDEFADGLVEAPGIEKDGGVSQTPCNTMLYGAPTASYSASGEHARMGQKRGFGYSMVQNPDASGPDAGGGTAYPPAPVMQPANRRRRHLPMVDADGRPVVVWGVMVTADQHRLRAIAVVVQQVRAWGTGGGHRGA